MVLLLPHATLLLISFFPRGTWTSEALPPVLSLSNYAAPLATRASPAVVNSLWMASSATAVALALGFPPPGSVARRSRCVTGWKP